MAGFHKSMQYWASREQAGPQAPPPPTGPPPAHLLAKAVPGPPPSSHVLPQAKSEEPAPPRCKTGPMARAASTRTDPMAKVTASPPPPKSTVDAAMGVPVQKGSVWHNHIPPVLMKSSGKAPAPICPSAEVPRDLSTGAQPLPKTPQPVAPPSVAPSTVEDEVLYQGGVVVDLEEGELESRASSNQFTDVPPSPITPAETVLVSEDEDLVGTV